MKDQWAKILLFSLFAFAFGYMVSHMCRGSGCHRGGCGSQSSCHVGDGGCAHGGVGKAGCCERGHGHGEHFEGREVKRIVKGLEAAGFEGDTTIAIDGGTVQVMRNGDKVEVQVEMEKTEGTEKVMRREVEVVTE